MGILDSIEQAAGMGGGEGQNVSTEDQGKVAGGFIHAAEQHPGGLGGLMDTLRQNGMGNHLDQWSQGNSQSIAPQQVEQGMGGGLLQQIAGHAGVSPGVATGALAMMLPMLMQHLAPGGQPAAPQGQLGGLAQSVLGRIL